MAASELAKIARTLVAEGKGILAADESTGTIEKRLKSIDVESTEETRRAYRDLLFTTDGAADYISGVILYDETIRQSASDGTPSPSCSSGTGSSLDQGRQGGKAPRGSAGRNGHRGPRRPARAARRYASSAPGSLSGEPSFNIGDGSHALRALTRTPHALGALCGAPQEAGLVPIVEPEVLMDGDHTVERCYEATETTLHAVFTSSSVHRVDARGNAPEAQHGPVREGRAQAGERPGGGRADVPVPEGDRAPCRSRHRVPVRRPDRRAATRAPECDEPRRATSRGSSASPTGERSKRPCSRRGAGRKRTSRPPSRPTCTERV